MFSATGGRYSLSFSQNQYHLVSDHKIPICTFLYERVCTPLHNIYNTPHRHAQTLGTFTSGLCKLLLLRLRHLPILRRAGIRMDSLQECHHPPPSEKLVAALPGLYEWNCSFFQLSAPAGVEVFFIF